MSAPNPLRGEAEIGGHKLVVDFNSMAALERRTGYRVPELLQLASDGLGFDELRTWVGVLLVEQIEEASVGDILGAAIASADGHTFDDRFQIVAGLVSSALEGFFAPKKDEPAPPRKAE